jgi:hypothetical protein
MATVPSRARRVRRTLTLATLAASLTVAGLTTQTSAGAAEAEPVTSGIAGGPPDGLARAEVLRPAATWPDGSYHSMTPARFYDSRREGAQTKLGPNETRIVQIAGRNGVPGAAQVKAVAMNVTVDAPTAASFVTVSPTGVGVPNVSSVNFQPGRTVPNLIIVDLGLDGNVQIFNGGGQSHVILDVVGYFSTSSGAGGGGLYMLDTPNRVLDTRVDAPVGGFNTRTTFGLAGSGGVAYDTEFRTVITNATVQSQGTGFVSFYPEGLVPPDISNLNFPGVIAGSDPAGLFVSNTVFAPLNAGGTYVGYTDSRPGSPKVQMLIDELGAFDDDGLLDAGDGSFLELSMLETPASGPYRVWDSRGGYGSCTTKCPLPGGTPFTLDFSAVIPDPSVTGLAVDALALNVTIDSPTQSTFLTVYPNDIPTPNVSTLNFLAGQTTAHATIVRIDPANPVVTFFMPAGTANLIVDFLGQFEYPI